MEAKLFADLTKILAGAVKAGGPAAVGSPLSKVMLKHANKRQETVLLADFPELYYISRRGSVSVRRKSRSTGVVEAEDSHSLADETQLRRTYTLGGYGHEAGAQREADQFMHPNVFQYQSAIFPLPRDHGVKVEVEKAEPVELKSPASPLNPWGVALTLSVQGRNASVWMKKFEDRIRTMRAT